MSKLDNAHMILAFALLISVTGFLLYGIWWVAVQVMLSRLGVVA